MRHAFLALVPFVAATSASALTYYPGAVGVRITSATGSFIQLAEVVVTDNEGVDVASAANGGTAFAPSQFDAASGAANAIDGNTSGIAATGIYRSAGSAGDFLDIYLGRKIVLSSVVLYGRTDGGAAAANLYDIQVFDSLGRSLFDATVDARLGPKTTWVDVIGTAVIPGSPITGPLPDVPPRLIGGAVPEPASWALLIAGFGLIGTALRRRRAVLA